MFRILFVLILLVLPFGAYAQLSVGIRGGYATSSYSYQATASTRSASVDGIGAPTFAFVLEYFNSKNAGIELNVQQLTLGFRQFSIEEELNHTELTYLKFPLLASFFVGKSGRFQIKVGPHLTDTTRPHECHTLLQIGHDLLLMADGQGSRGLAEILPTDLLAH